MKNKGSTINNTTEDQIKNGCLLPLLVLAIATLVSLFLYNILNNKNPELTEKNQIEEMIISHSDKGLVTNENGFMIIKR